MPSTLPPKHIVHLLTWGLIFQFRIFSPFHTFHGVLMARILKWVAVASPSGHILSELFTMTHLFWVALHGMAHSFIELLKPLHHNMAVIHQWVPCSSCTHLRNIASWWGEGILENLWKHFWCHNQGVGTGI